MLGHVERMSGDRLLKRMLYRHPGGTRQRGKPKFRWLQAEEESCNLKIRDRGLRTVSSNNGGPGSS